MTKFSPYFCAFGFLLLLFSCSKEDKLIEGFSLKGSVSESMTVLGSQFDDPYKLDNMQTALDSLLRLGLESPVEKLDPTGYYVRVLPLSDADMDTLESDSTICWSDFPLDYDINVLGSYYQDPAPSYSPIFIDLMDEANSSPYDLISGYSLLEIKNLLLKNSTNLVLLNHTLNNNLKHGATVVQVDSLCNKYLRQGLM